MDSLPRIILIFGIFLLVNLQSSSALQCYSCNSNFDPWCKYQQNPADSASLVQCDSSVTKCMEFVNNVNGIVMRQCLFPDTTICGSEDGVCETCETDLCNSKQLAFEECATCDSDRHKDCLVTSNLTNVLQCTAATVDRAGCYLESDSWDPTVVRRGCVSDLNEADFKTCSENGETCKICHGDSCNLKGEWIF